MKTKTIALAFLAVLLALALFVTPAYAQSIPALPHAFYGTAEVNGSPAPVGTEVEVRGEGVQTGAGNNPIVVTAAGNYGSSNPLEPKLIVQGDIADSTILTFYVNGVSTGQTVEWHSGEVTEVNLSVTGEIPPPGTTAAPPPETTEAPPPETTEPTPPETTEPTPPEPTEPTPPETTVAPSPETTEPTPAASAEPVNWSVLWWVIGGVVVVGIITLILARRKSY